MTRITLFTATLLASLIAIPALAQQSQGMGRGMMGGGGMALRRQQCRWLEDDDSGRAHRTPEQDAQHEELRRVRRLSERAPQADGTTRQGKKASPRRRRAAAPAIR